MYAGSHTETMLNIEPGSFYVYTGSPRMLWLSIFMQQSTETVQWLTNRQLINKNCTISMTVGISGPVWQLLLGILRLKLHKTHVIIFTFFL